MAAAFVQPLEALDQDGQARPGAAASAIRSGDEAHLVRGRDLG